MTFRFFFFSLRVYSLVNILLIFVQSLRYSSGVTQRCIVVSTRASEMMLKYINVIIVPVKIEPTTIIKLPYVYDENSTAPGRAVSAITKEIAI